MVEKVPQWIPPEPTLNNYAMLFDTSNGTSIGLAFWNSVFVAVLTIVLTLVLSVPAAYALARLKFRGRQAVFFAYVAILAFPPVLFLIPDYYIVNVLGLMSSPLALVLPIVAGTFGVFMLRQFMLGISKDLEDAAWMDGATRFRFMISVVIPFVKPAMVVLSLMTFIASWNNFLWPLLVLVKPDSMTLPIALVRFTVGWGDPIRGIGPLMSGAFISVVPTLLLFVFFHRQLMQGVSLGAVDK